MEGNMIIWMTLAIAFQEPRKACKVRLQYKTLWNPTTYNDGYGKCHWCTSLQFQYTIEVALASFKDCAIISLAS